MNTILKGNSHSLNIAHILGVAYHPATQETETHHKETQHLEVELTNGKTLFIFEEKTHRKPTGWVIDSKLFSTVYSAFFEEERIET